MGVRVEASATRRRARAKQVALREPARRGLELHAERCLRHQLAWGKGRGRGRDMARVRVRVRVRVRLRARVR